tara:strand:+ start:3555 stop:3707 length:153 start_codon:yes stop_codon:yes gene_type:complete
MKEVEKKIKEKKKLPKLDKSAIKKSEVMKQTSILDYFGNKNNNIKKKIFV